VTPAMSMQCSPAELYAHPMRRIHHTYFDTSIEKQQFAGLVCEPPGRKPSGGVQHLLDLVDEVAQMEGLGQNLGVLGCL
jgi:hypothetical protein